jgi:hypothetical protein
MQLPKSPEGLWNHAPPRRVLGESDAQGPRTTAGHAAGALSRFVHLLENAPRILQEQLAGGTQLHAARETFKKFEAELRLQILNLAGKRWLSHVQPARRTTVMLLFADRHEVSEMPQLHSDTY